MTEAGNIRAMSTPAARLEKRVKWTVGPLLDEAVSLMELIREPVDDEAFWGALYLARRLKELTNDPDLIPRDGTELTTDDVADSVLTHVNAVRAIACLVSQDQELYQSAFPELVRLCVRLWVDVADALNDVIDRTNEEVLEHRRGLAVRGGDKTPSPDCRVNASCP
jgi:hypothetical protein